MVAVFPTLEANRGLPLAYRWRCMECGNREIETTTKAGRFLIGADGQVKKTYLGRLKFEQLRADLATM